MKQGGVRWRLLFRTLSCLVALSAFATATPASVRSPTPTGPTPYAAHYRPGLQAAGVGAAARATWCGTEATADDRPDALPGAQVHVLYAIPADGADRFFALAPLLVADLSAVERWWQSQDPGRTPRFDLFAAPGCEPGLGRLDLSFVRLNSNADYYAPPNEQAIYRLWSELPFQLQRTHKKLLTFYDGAVQIPELCGVGGGNPTRGGPFSGAIVYLRSACAQDLGAGGLLAATSAHELLHALGAVPEGAPHLCLGGHVCDGERDLMLPSVQPLAQAVLDSGRDDYYGHPSSWFDTQDSQWLRNIAAPQASLIVTLGESGTLGRVASEPPGIDCPPTCSLEWDAGTQLELFAASEGGARFAGWSGSCTGRGECALVMTESKTLSANFVRQLTLRVDVVKRGGAGVVRGILRQPCTGQCLRELDEGAKVRLVAKAARRSRFLGWSGRCSGRGACSLRMDSDARVAAVFGPELRS